MTTAHNATIPNSHFERSRSAFRTQRLTTDEETLLINARSIHVKFLLAVPLAVLLGGIIAFFGLALALQLTCLFGVGIFFRRAWTRTPGAIRLLRTLVLAIVLAYVAATFLKVRLIATIILSLAMLCIFLHRGRRPLTFHQEWLVADVRLPPGDEARLKPIPLGPSVPLLLAVCGIVTAVPLLHSASFAIVLLALVLVGYVLYHATRTQNAIGTVGGVWTLSKLIHLNYLAYPDARPAIWSGGESLAARKRTFTLLWLSTASLLTVGLSYCMPWELLASHSVPGFFWQVPPTRADSEYAWLLQPFLLALGASRDYWWVIIIGAALSMVLPYAIIFAAYFPALQRIGLAAAAAEDSAETDTRSDFEKYVSRLHKRR
jgi:hypothetical protein